MPRHALLFIFVLVISPLSAWAQGWTGFGGVAVVSVRADARLLATAPPSGTPWYHTRSAPLQGNGRIWRQRAVTRIPSQQPRFSADDQARYGAEIGDRSLVFAWVGTEVVAFSPWQRFADQGYSRLNEARGVWLAERGYTGGVRTFMSPRVVQRTGRGAGERDGIDAIEPAGWFRVPAEMPRTRPVERVRFSPPPGMDPTLAARLSAPPAMASRSD